MFCQIVMGDEPASVVHEDELALCFMTIRPTRPGECLVISKQHVDEFIDLPEGVLRHLTDVARQVGLALRDEYAPDRVGMVIHGYGVAHVHLILLPQHSPDDITSARFMVSDGAVEFRHDVVAEASREELDEHARRLRQRLGHAPGAP